MTRLRVHASPGYLRDTSNCSKMAATRLCDTLTVVVNHVDDPIGCPSQEPLCRDTVGQPRTGATKEIAYWIGRYDDLEVIPLQEDFQPFSGQRKYRPPDPRLQPCGRTDLIRTSSPACLSRTDNLVRHRVGQWAGGVTIPSNASKASSPISLSRIGYVEFRLIPQLARFGASEHRSYRRRCPRGLAPRLAIWKSRGNVPDRGNDLLTGTHALAPMVTDNEREFGRVRAGVGCFGELVEGGVSGTRNRALHAEL